MKTTIYFFISSFFFLTSNFAIGQETHHVPADFSTIEIAMQNALTGDTVLVAPGIYYENIQFHGKDIYLTSEFLHTKDRTSIENTIIDGSQPAHADTASVIRVISNETSNAVIRGFTITGGTGTKTYNTAEMLYFRTGGGISVDHASPTIINNIIRNNICTAGTGVTGAGGGGLRVGFGTPYIANNIITQNSGGYAGGIMIAYCEGMYLENNLISYNHSDGDFGGGAGVYVDWENINIINNTIVNNDSDGTGGGLCITGNTSTIKNCIIYGNEASSPSTASIRKRFSGNPVVSYTNIAGEWTGTGNIDVDPMYLDEVYFELNSLSPCVDTGGPSVDYNDQADTETGVLLLPAKGDVRNDMGAYGGQHYEPIPLPAPVVGIHEALNVTFELSKKGDFLFVKQNKRGYLYLRVFNRSGQLLEVLHVGILEEGTHQFKLSNTGFHFIQAQDSNGVTQTIKSFQ